MHAVGGGGGGWSTQHQPAAPQFNIADVEITLQTESDESDPMYIR